MSDELVAAISAVLVQIVGIVAILLKARKTEVKVDKVEQLVNGAATRLEARVASQEATIHRLLAKLPESRA